MIITLTDLPKVRRKNTKQKVVLTSGTFDLLHTGHLNYLEKVKEHGDIVIVLLSGDKRVKARKGDKRPIIPEAERARMLDALRIVDYVLIDPSEKGPDEIDPVHAKIVEILKPDAYVTDGPDPRFYLLMDKSRFIILDRMNPEPSTTAIIERILNNGSSS